MSVIHNNIERGQIEGVADLDPHIKMENELSQNKLIIDESNFNRE